MFDEIFKRWVDTNELTQEDLVPIFLEYDRVFNDGNVTAEQLVALLQHPFVQMNIGQAVDNIMHWVGIKEGYEWMTIYSPQGQLIRRVWNK